MTEKDNEIMEDDELIVVMTDEEGNEYYYREELIIPVGDQRFALLVEIQEEDCEEGCGDGCDCGCGEENVVIAKIVVDENGEEIYVDPTDEEFEEVQKAYDELMEDDEEA